MPSVRAIVSGKLMLLAVVGAVAVAVAVVVSTAAKPIPTAVAPTRPAPAPTPSPPTGTLDLWSGDGIREVEANGTFRRWLAPPRPSWEAVRPVAGVVSPDGEWVAWESVLLRPGVPGTDQMVSVRRFSHDSAGKQLAHRKYAGILGWVGGTLYYRGGDEEADHTRDLYDTGPFTVWGYDPATEKQTACVLPDEHTPFAVLPDGSAVLTLCRTSEGAEVLSHVCRVKLADAKVKVLFDLGADSFSGWAVSPDGESLLGVWTEYEKLVVQDRKAGDAKVSPFGDRQVSHAGERSRAVVRIDLATGKRTTLAKAEYGPDESPLFVWSPDGRHFATVVSRRRERKPTDDPRHGNLSTNVVTICNADGSGANVVTRLEAEPVVRVSWR